MGNAREKTVLLEVFVKTVTPGAAYLVYEDDEQWVPRSTLGGITDRDIEGRAGNEMTIRMAEWKAKQLGWV